MPRGTLSPESRLRQSNTRLKRSVKLLTEHIDILQKENTELRLKLTDLGYQFEQMKTIVFGKKKDIRKILDDEDDTPPKIERTKESYNRPIPKRSEITKTIHHRLPRVRKVEKTRERTFYIEDIPLDVHKTVTEHIIHQVWRDGHWVGDIPLPPKTVLIGDNVRILVATLSVEQRLSYTQIIKLLEMLFHIHVSEGEIYNILSSEAEKVSTAYQVILESIQQEPFHNMDETSWAVKGERSFAWSITGKSATTAYLLGKTRGKGNAEFLRGDSVAVLVSDDYLVYRKLAKHHQLCWAHLIRKFRDFAEHLSFDEAAHLSVLADYTEIKHIFRELQSILLSAHPELQENYFIQRLTTVSTIQTLDPPPVHRIKKTLQQNILKYLTALRFPDVPLTNNTAERSLRHLVIKRRISFGSTSHTGANNLAILMTVIKNILRHHPGEYFEKYRELRV